MIESVCSAIRRVKYSMIGYRFEDKFTNKFTNVVDTHVEPIANDVSLSIMVAISAEILCGSQQRQRKSKWHKR